MARGSYARRAGEQPRWLPGLRVALDQYRQLEPPVTLAEIRQRKDELLALRQRLQAHASGQPIYLVIINQGRLIAAGPMAGLLERSQASSLEDLFLGATSTDAQAAHAAFTRPRSLS